MQRIGRSPVVLHTYKKTQRKLKDLLTVLIPKIRRGRPPTHIIRAKFIKESNWLKKAFFIPVHEKPLPKDEIFTAQGWEVSMWGFWQAK